MSEIVRLDSARLSSPSTGLPSCAAVQEVFSATGGADALPPLLVPLPPVPLLPAPPLPIGRPLLPPVFPAWQANNSAMGSAETRRRLMSAPP